MIAAYFRFPNLPARAHRSDPLHCRQYTVVRLGTYLAGSALRGLAIGCASQQFSPSFCLKRR